MTVLQGVDAIGRHQHQPAPRVVVGLPVGALAQPAAHALIGAAVEYTAASACRSGTDERLRAVACAGGECRAASTRVRRLEFGGDPGRRSASASTPQPGTLTSGERGAPVRFVSISGRMAHLTGSGGAAERDALHALVLLAGKDVIGVGRLRAGGDGRRWPRDRGPLHEPAQQVRMVALRTLHCAARTGEPLFMASPTGTRFQGGP